MPRDVGPRPEEEHHAEPLLWQTADAECMGEKVQGLGHLKVWSGPEKQTSNMDSIPLNQ
jgi:hypothetical protein